jgi:hypothetical protein
LNIGIAKIEPSFLLDSPAGSGVADQTNPQSLGQDAADLLATGSAHHHCSPEDTEVPFESPGGAQ